MTRCDSPPTEVRVVGLDMRFLAFWPSDEAAGMEGLAANASADIQSETEIRVIGLSEQPPEEQVVHVSGADGQRQALDLTVAALDRLDAERRDRAADLNSEDGGIGSIGLDLGAAIRDSLSHGPEHRVRLFFETSGISDPSVSTMGTVDLEPSSMIRWTKEPPPSPPSVLGQTIGEKVDCTGVEATFFMPAAIPLLQRLDVVWGDLRPMVEEYWVAFFTSCGGSITFR